MFIGGLINFYWHASLVLNELREVSHDVMPYQLKRVHLSSASIEYSQELLYFP